MPNCIYCAAPDPRSREHWILRGLGSFNGYTPLLNRLCQTCNERLGQELDEEFLRTGQIGFQRALHGVRGRAGHAPVNPFHYRAMGGQQPNTMMMPIPHAQHHVLAEAYRDADGNRCSKPLRQLVVRNQDGALQCMPFPRAWTAEHLRQGVAARGLADGRVVEIYFEQDEDVRAVVAARELVREVFSDLSEAVAYMGVSGEREVRSISFAGGITRRYLRALAKIAFHYALWACPAINGDEPVFSDVRAFISEGGGDPNDFVQLNAAHFMPQQAKGFVPLNTSHFFHTRVLPDGIVSWLQFFVGRHDHPAPVRVLLGAGAPRVTDHFVTCHQAEYASERSEGFDGRIIQIQTVER